MAQEGPRRAPRGLQDGQDGAKRAHDGSKMAPGRPQEGSRQPKLTTNRCFWSKSISTNSSGSGNSSSLSNSSKAASTAASAPAEASAASAETAAASAAAAATTAQAVQERRVHLDFEHSAKKN